MYSDSHVHTAFSGDSETSAEDQIRQAVSLGMTDLTITDHQDFDYPPTEEEDISFDLDMGVYPAEISRLRELYSRKIRLHFGVELGLQPWLGKRLQEFAGCWPFDFIIGSTHLCRGADPYYPAFFETAGEEEIYRSYFEEARINLRSTDCFDIAGHLDYIFQYGPTKNTCYPFSRYSDLIDDILKDLICRGKGIECNTGGYDAGLGGPMPGADILRRYRELGGEIITLGSDAHVPGKLGRHFEEAGALLRACGFRYYAVYTGHRPEFYPL